MVPRNSTNPEGVLCTLVAFSVIVPSELTSPNNLSSRALSILCGLQSRLGTNCFGILTGLSPKRDYDPERVKAQPLLYPKHGCNCPAVITLVWTGRTAFPF